VVAQIYGVGIITSKFTGLEFGIGVFVGLAGILVCSVLGGMRAVTWTQVAQYIILIIAYLIPVVWLSTKLYGNPIPELAYGAVLDQISEFEKKLGILKPHVAAYVDAKGQFSWVEFNNFWALTLTLMIGTASLPHILMRYFTTPNVRDARTSVGWSIFFIFLLYFTAPAYAAFAKLEVYSNVIGQQISQLPAWVQNWSQVGGLLTIKDANNDGIVQLAEFVINQDIIVLSMPEIAGLPYVISGLVAAGGLAAALSTADGLLLAIANALSHDVYYKMITPLRSAVRYLVVSVISIAVIGVIAVFLTGPSPVALTASWLPGALQLGAIPWNWLLLVGLVLVLLIVTPFWFGSSESAKRLIVARVLLLFVAVAAAATASTRPSDILAMVGWAFSLAMAGNFPALVMGIWWKRTTTAAAIWGIIAGFGLCLFYLVCTRYFPGYGVRYFGMSSLLNTATGVPVVDLAKAMALPNAMDVFVAGSHPMAGKVGWFNLNNINCGMLGAPLGFLVIYVVSFFTKPPSTEMMAFVDEIRKPRGQTVLEEKTT
jgi:cation/acetate symporter